MNEENGKHEFNFFLDKQLQQKLLEANEELLEKEFSSSLFANSGVQTSNVSAGKCNNNSNNNSVGGAQQNSKLPKYCVHVCGWCPDPGVVYRKSEIDLIPRSRVNLAVTRESLFSRDAKLRPQNINNFVFRHYSDPRKYIEQYRKEHACYDSTNSSATKNEFLETRRFYAYNQYSPLAVGFNTNSYQSNSYVPQPQLDSHGQNTENILKSHQQTPALQYTNRRDQKRQTISANLNTKNQHLFKLSKTPPSKPDIHVNDYTEEYIESLEVNSKQRHSAKERSTAITNGNYHKSAATKINVPSANFTGKPLRTSNSGANPESTLPSHFTGHKGGQVQVNTSRMLDTLSCMANSTGGSADKQPQLPSLPNPNSASKSGTASTPSSQKRQSTITANNPTTTTTANATTPTLTPIPGHNIITKTTRTVTPTTPRDPKPSFTNNTGTNSMSNTSTKETAFANSNSMKLNRHNTLLTQDKSNVGRIIDDDLSSIGGSDVSMSQLSTACLGADVNVKTHPKLEASRTYHVFPSEFSHNDNGGGNHHQQSSQNLSVVWNPDKSAVVEKRIRPSNTAILAAADIGIAGPFRNSPRRPATEEGSFRTVEFITKEFVQDARPLNLRTTDIFKDIARMSVSQGLKTNTIKPDLPASFSLQGVSKRPHFETLKKKRRASKTAVVRRKKDHQFASQEADRKSRSASTDASNNSTTGGGANNLRLKPVSVESGHSATGSFSASGAANSSSTNPAPYFKFWNSSLPAKSREGRRRGGGDKLSDINMQQLAEMVLADENGKTDIQLAQAAKKVLEHTYKSENEQGIATGASGLPPAVNGAAKSKEELLESLRLVNQRPSKPPSRPLHLTFYQEEKKYHIHKNSEPHSFPLEKKQLHESDENSISDSCTNCHGNENNHLNKEEQDINSSDDDGKTNHPRIVYSGIDTNSNLDVSNDTSCLKEESNRSDLAELKYDGAILSLEKDQHMKFDVFSDWRQLRADYEGVSSSGGKVHVNGGEYRRLSMVKKIEERASLSHRRRIKQLIEQSRLKSHLGKLWMHNKSGKLGKENGRQGSFHELTSGYRDGTDGIDQLGGVGMNCVKKTHRNNDSGASTDTVRGKSYSKTGGDAIVEDHLVSKTADDNDTYGYRAMNFEREKCKSAGSEYSSSSGREVGARSDLIHSRKYGRKKDKRNQGLTVVTNCTMEDGIQGKDITNECRQNFYYNENESTVLSTSGVRDIRNSERLGNINKNNDNDIDVLENEGAGVMFTMAKDTLKSQQNVNSTSPLMVPRSNAVSGYDDHAEYSFNVSKYPSIPFVYGTAIRENPVIKSNALKNRNHSLNASPKQRKLSPLSDPTIQVVAEKMAVKINVTKLRYTKVGDVKRSRSMYL